MVKRILCLALCLGMIFLLSAQADSLTYLALGDSISTGYGLKNARKECFAYLLADELGYNLINRSVNGNTTGGLMLQLTDKSIQKYITNASMITITIGGNDMMALFYSALADAFSTMSSDAMTLSVSDIAAIMSNPSDTRMTMLMMCVQLVLLGNPAAGMPSFMESDTFKAGLDAYAAALKNIVSTIHTLNPNAQVFVATQYNPFAGFTGMYAALSSGFDAGIRMLNETIKAHAETGNYQVTDVYHAFSGSQDYLYNATMDPLYLDIHPNAAGHKVIQETFLQTIAPQL